MKAPVFCGESNSAALLAMREAKVSPPLNSDQVQSARGQGRHDEGDRDRLAERAAEGEHRGADDAGLAERQDSGADHLPPGGTEGQRTLLVRRGRLGEDLARDGGDDRAGS
jgi:hypothetical protein